MYNSKKGVVIDNVGVLLDDPLANLDWLAARYGVDEDRLNQAKNRIWVKEFSVDPEMTPYQFWSKVFGEAGVVIDQNDAEKINNEIIDRHYPHERMLEYVRELRENPDVVTNLWTNVSSDWIYKFDKKLELTKTFDYIAASGLEGKRKNNPDFVRNMLGRLKEDGCSHISGVDDQESNLEILRGAGVDPAILYTGEEQAIKELDRFISERYEE